MIGRHQLPVASPVSLAAISRAIVPALRQDKQPLSRLTRVLQEEYGARTVALTDSGTSALVLALRIAAGEGKTVAYPGYACVDLAAAAQFAGVRIRLYDIDPQTLSPDLDSLRATIARGVDAIVVAHLYGFPADMTAVTALAAQHDIPVIEDAAQGAGGTLNRSLLGKFGALSVLSFGRGKGTTGGHGGALLCNDPKFESEVSRAAQLLGVMPSGWNDLLGLAAQFVLGRPSLYGIPSAIPGLRLGEMVYHPAHEPQSISRAAASLVSWALEAARREVVVRQRNAGILALATVEGGDIDTPRPVAGGTSGYLRFPALDRGARVERPTLGILRGYPRTLHEQTELQSCLVDGEPATPGAEDLRRTLFTLPTHSLMTRRDIDRCVQWIRIPNRMIAPMRGGKARSAYASQVL